jgi:hypothetical protein
MKITISIIGVGRKTSKKISKTELSNKKTIGFLTDNKQGSKKYEPTNRI